MNIFDIVLLMVLVVAFVAGWRQGLVAQLFSFGGLIVGVLLASAFGPQIGGCLIPDRNVLNASCQRQDVVTASSPAVVRELLGN